MKQILFIFLLLTFSFISFAQKVNIYDVKADGIKQFEEAKIKAKAENKHILLQIGGNWCSWCVKFHKFCKEDKQLDSLINADYVVVKINYSGENKNLSLLEKLEFPHRFGYPVFVVSNSEGRRLHTQNSWYLEEGKSYSKKKVEAFFKNWTVKAVSGVK